MFDMFDLLMERIQRTATFDSESIHGWAIAYLKCARTLEEYNEVRIAVELATRQMMLTLELRDGDLT